MIQARYDRLYNLAVDLFTQERMYMAYYLVRARAAVLDTYFDELSVETVAPGDGWERIAQLPRLWPAV